MSHLATFIVFSLPWIIEVVIETYYEKEKKVSVNHFWTAAGRGALIVMIAITVGKWEAIVYMVALHWMFFDYTYNLLTDRKWYYLRNGGIDKWLRIVPGYGLLLWRVIFLIFGFMLYNGYTK